MMVPSRFDPPVYSVQLVCLDLINHSSDSLVANDRLHRPRRIGVSYERRGVKSTSIQRAPSLFLDVGGGKNLFVTEEVSGLRLTVDEPTHFAVHELSTGYLDLEEFRLERTARDTTAVPSIREIVLRVGPNTDAPSHVLKLLVSVVEVGPLTTAREETGARQRTISTQTNEATPPSQGKNIGIQAGVKVDVRDVPVQCDPQTASESLVSSYTAANHADAVAGERRAYTLVLAFIIRRFCAKLLAVRMGRIKSVTNDKAVQTQFSMPPKLSSSERGVVQFIPRDRRPTRVKELQTRLARICRRDHSEVERVARRYQKQAMSSHTKPKDTAATGRRKANKGSLSPSHSPDSGNAEELQSIPSSSSSSSNSRTASGESSKRHSSRTSTSSSTKTQNSAPSQSSSSSSIASDVQGRKSDTGGASSNSGTASGSSVISELPAANDGSLSSMKSASSSVPTVI